MKEIFEKYIYSQDGLHSGLAQTLELLRPRVLSINAESDIQLFLEEKKTNLKPPPPLDFEGLPAGSILSAIDQYKITLLPSNYSFNSSYSR